MCVRAHPCVSVTCQRISHHEIDKKREMHRVPSISHSLEDRGGEWQAHTQDVCGCRACQAVVRVRQMPDAQPQRKVYTKATNEQKATQYGVIAGISQ